MSDLRIGKFFAVIQIVFGLALLTIFVFDFLWLKALSLANVAILAIIGLFVLSAGRGLAGITFAGVDVRLDKELKEVKHEVDTLRSQVYTLGQTAIVQQVNTLNRLAIEKPELAQKAWKKLERLDADQIKQLSYAYAFIDIFDMLRRFQAHEAFARELYLLWEREWMPDLLASEIGKLMKANRELLSYYSEETIIALGLQGKN